MRPNAERESERLDQPTAVEVIPTGACIGAEVKNVELSCYCWALGLPSDAPRPSVPAVSVNSTGGPELPQLAQQANDSREDDFFAWMAAPRVLGPEAR